jgi:hypothetical protein
MRAILRAICCGILAVATLASVRSAGWAQDSSTLGLLELQFKPTSSAQLAVWIERADGTFMGTARLTEAVAYRGIGNRPGASQMNSGFRWPYGRREGALPVWATRRAAAPDAKQFRRVIFQDRESEGLASRTSDDYSVDNYYCLSFRQDRSAKDALDAVSCASVFNSDKGRFVVQNDLDAQYSEPYEDEATRTAHMRALPAESLYPPRRDVRPCMERLVCYDHPDVGAFDAHVREVIPDIDAITMATPVGDVAQQILFPLPAEWAAGEYRACVEINTEGDYNDVWNDLTLPVPHSPPDKWDSWAMNYGYPYRGQPSVVYCTDFDIGGNSEQSYTSSEPVGSAGTWNYEDPTFGMLHTMDGMTNDPVGAPGSGADRLGLMDEGWRLRATVKPPLSCRDDVPPSAVTDFSIAPHPDKLHAHQWVQLSFRASSDDRGVARYDVRVSTLPITDDKSFRSAMQAKQASIAAPELLVPTSAPPGEMIHVEMGGLVQETHYYVAVRAMDGCSALGPLSVQEVTTPAREFTTVSPCFVATAAFGSPLEERVSVLRGLRDRYLQSNAPGRAFVSAYYAVGPAFADAIRQDEGLRAAVRAVLTPVVDLGKQLSD